MLNDEFGKCDIGFRSFGTPAPDIGLKHRIQIQRLLLHRRFIHLKQLVVGRVRSGQRLGNLIAVWIPRRLITSGFGHRSAVSSVERPQCMAGWCEKPTKHAIRRKLCAQRFPCGGGTGIHFRPAELDRFQRSRAGAGHFASCNGCDRLRKRMPKLPCRGGQLADDLAKAQCRRIAGDHAVSGFEPPVLGGRRPRIPGWHRAVRNSRNESRSPTSGNR